MASANPLKRMWDFLNAYDDDEELDSMPPTSPTPQPSPAPRRQRGNLTLPGSQEGGMTIRHPQSMDDRRLVGDDLRHRRTVTLNLTRLSEADARLFLEFISGVAYALDAHMKKVHDGIFLVIPRGMALHQDTDEADTPAAAAQPAPRVRIPLPRSASARSEQTGQEELFWQER